MLTLKIDRGRQRLTLEFYSLFKVASHRAVLTRDETEDLYRMEVYLILDMFCQLLQAAYDIKSYL